MSTLEEEKREFERIMRDEHKKDLAGLAETEALMGRHHIDVKATHDIAELEAQLAQEMEARIVAARVADAERKRAEQAEAERDEAVDRRRAWKKNAEACSTVANRFKAENTRLQEWVHDLQSVMYINCVYCGHRYGPEDEVPATMADALKEHIEQCPKHPMSALKAENAKLREACQEVVDAWDKEIEGDLVDGAVARCVDALDPSE